MRIVFCGVGALGSTAVLFCRNLNMQPVLVDFDRVESKNLLAQCYVKQSIGKNKAQALKMQLANFYGIQAQVYTVKMTGDNVDTILKGAGLVVDCFDNAAGRRLLSDYAREHGIPLLHGAISADGVFGLVRWNEHFEADEEDVPGQATCEGGEHLPMIATVSATLARAIQDFIQHRVKKDYQISLNGVMQTA